MVSSSAAAKVYKAGEDGEAACVKELRGRQEESTERECDGCRRRACGATVFEERRDTAIRELQDEGGKVDARAEVGRRG